MNAAFERALARIELEPRNRYITLNCVTGEFSQHSSRGQATLAYLRIMADIDCYAPRPQIMEWSHGDWKCL